MPEISQIKDKYYIKTTSTVVDPYRIILKDGDLFGIFDRYGDILPLGKNEQGLYYNGTRFLSYYELRINGFRPLYLSSNVDEDNILMTIDLTNPDILLRNKLLMKKDSVHIMHCRFLSEGQCLEYIRMKNFCQETIRFKLEISVDADFRDIFEIRGVQRKKRGTLSKPFYEDGILNLSYKGLDGLKRSTKIKFVRTPDAVKGKFFTYNICLEPHSTDKIFITIKCMYNDSEKKVKGFRDTLLKVRKGINVKKKDCTDIYTSNEQFNETIKRSLSDINMMLTKNAYGFYPYGGIPWYCTPFGRDAIITSLECLWINPLIAQGVLRYLASFQAQDLDREKFAEPGKIPHEIRGGEMAALKEIPFGLYYGNVDSTLLFIVLAGNYWRRTADTPLIRKIWGNIEQALLWIDNYGDLDGDGFIEYIPDKNGLRNQGWKDSEDSVFHKDGSLAEGPIALCEVQSYVYAAKREAAILSHIVSKKNLTQRLLEEAENLKKKFNKVFWDDELQCYILALDGKKKPCRVVSSNAGHTLFTGISEPDKALKVADTLISQKMFSGWGIRTIASDELLYNPMSYHNGSVWPHDNAIIAYGFASNGFKEHFLKIFSGVFDTSLFMEFQRLPELFCGFHKRKGTPPTLYPIACSPQTWASGSILFMLQASLGISFNASDYKIIFDKPILPEFLNYVYLKNLTVIGNKSIDLLIRRFDKDVTIEVQRKPDDVHILITK